MNTEVAAEELKVEETKVEEATVEAPKEEPKKETRTFSQEEVDKILAKVRKNERYRTRKEVEAFYQGRESVKPADEKKEEKPADREPIRGDYESYEAFIEARADYRARKAVAEERAKDQQQSKEKQETESRQKTHQGFQTKVREKYPDIDELIADVGDMPMYRGVQDAISDSPLGPEIFHALLQDPKEFDRLVGMSEPAAIREIGKLEARLEAKTPKAEKETKPASKAPAPVAPPGGQSAASSDLPSDSDSTEEWMRKERARLAKLRK